MRNEGGLKDVPAVFFIDEGLGGRIIGAALRAAGEKVALHEEHFGKGAQDVEWLAFAAQRKWLILTKDNAIARNPLEMAVVKETGACVFALASAQMTGPEMAEAFVLARHRMRQFARKFKGPFIAKVYRDGRVKPWKQAGAL